MKMVGHQALSWAIIGIGAINEYTTIFSIKFNLRNFTRTSQILIIFTTVCIELLNYQLISLVSKMR